MGKQESKAWAPPRDPSPMNVPAEHVVFIDSETVPCVHTFEELPERGKKLFIKKFQKEFDNGIDSEYQWKTKAALTSEFSKIVCVSIGVLVAGVPKLFRMKSFVGRDEEKLLKELEPKLLNSKYLCAHFGKRFDFPLLTRKFVQYGIPIPPVLQTI